MTEAAKQGLLIVNADDWGQDHRTTDCILDCVKSGSVSAVSAMVFMEDSARAASIAQEHAIDTGLHLNLTAPFTVLGLPAALSEHQRRIRTYLRRHRLAQLVFNPVLTESFDYVVRSQIDEFQRLYGVKPARLDGHHHMHLSANVLMQRLLPEGTLVRRNFSFQRGEKNIINRSYRRFVDGRLSSRHRLVDHLFSIAPLDPMERLERVFALARREVVELETHPAVPEEYRVLSAGGPFLSWTKDLPRTARFSQVRS